ncbi:MAG: protein-L-isoaspartate O-methyltransferase [Legionellaceae bacterium]|nr:protein-L-isoaspartate O-methyltransferase [Legionellaceae bacterium]
MNTTITSNNMIKQQLRTGNVLDESILELFESIPRDEFVPSAYKEFAYSDMQIPLPNQQKMMTPLEEALILQSLELSGDESILEIGTGSGFLTCLLSKLSKNVLSIDYFDDFLKPAQDLLTKYQSDNVQLISDDAYQGYADKAPYDVIIFSGAVQKISEIQRLQVLPGGKLIAIIGESPIMQAKLFKLDHKDNWTEKLIFETNIPPLIDKLNKKTFVF